MARKNEITKRSKAKKREELKAKYKANPNDAKDYTLYLEKQRNKMREYRAKTKGIYFLMKK